METEIEVQTGADKHPIEKTFIEVVPDLHDTHYKGQHGRIAVIGGSAQYVGAPYFSAMSSLRLGSDLCCVFCTEESSIPIKSLAPDLMVDALLPKASSHSNYMDSIDWDPEPDIAASVVSEFSKVAQQGLKIEDSELKEHQELQVSRIFCTDTQPTEEKEAVDLSLQRFDKWIPRINCLVVGPGLGRSKLSAQVAARAIQRARSRELPIAIDADGIRLIQLLPALLYGYDKAVITPNSSEFNKLFSSLCPESKDPGFSDGTTLMKQVQRIAAERSGPKALSFGTVEIARLDRIDGLVSVKGLANKLGGVTIVRKGSVDLVTSGGQFTYAVYEAGSLKRTGGLGDILSGCTGTWLHWCTKAQTNPGVPFAAMAACLVARRAGSLAFNVLGRSLVAHDVVPFVGPALDQLLKQAAKPR